MNNISFNGKSSETTGSIGERTSDSAINETTGSIGYYSFGEEGTPNIGRTLSRDAVSFHSYEGYEEKKSSNLGLALGVGSIAALAIIAGCGYAQKTNSVNKIKNEQVKKAITKITKPCYELCVNAKAKGSELYNKIFKKKAAC